MACDERWCYGMRPLSLFLLTLSINLVIANDNNTVNGRAVGSTESAIIGSTPSTVTSKDGKVVKSTTLNDHTTAKTTPLLKTGEPFQNESQAAVHPQGSEVTTTLPTEALPTSVKTAHIKTAPTLQDPTSQSTDRTTASPHDVNVPTAPVTALATGTVKSTVATSGTSTVKVAAVRTTVKPTLQTTEAGDVLVYDDIPETESAGNEDDTNIADKLKTDSGNNNNDKEEEEKPTGNSKPKSNTAIGYGEPDDGNIDKEEEEKPIENPKPKSKTAISYGEPDDGNSHFFVYFLTVVGTCIVMYVLFHNKQKILALIVEGRQERRRRPNTSQYRPLDNNLEEVIHGRPPKNGRSTNVIY